MDIKLFFSTLGILLVIGAYFHYCYSILKGKTKPHTYTWLILAIILFLSFAIQNHSHGGLGTYVLLIESLGATLVFLLSLKYGEKDIKTLDKISFLLAFISIALWLILDMPVISIILIILIDIFAMIPTFRKSYFKPHEETTIIYIVSLFIFSCSLLAIENYSFLTTGHQISVILSDGLLILMLLWRRNKLSHK